MNNIPLSGYRMWMLSQASIIIKDPVRLLPQHNSCSHIKPGGFIRPGFGGGFNILSGYNLPVFYPLLFSNH
jgi:hypothetical protein